MLRPRCQAQWKWRHGIVFDGELSPHAAVIRRFNSCICCCSHCSEPTSTLTLACNDDGAVFPSSYRTQQPDTGSRLPWSVCADGSGIAACVSSIDGDGGVTKTLEREMQNNLLLDVVFYINNLNMQHDSWLRFWNKCWTLAALSFTRNMRKFWRPGGEPCHKKTFWVYEIRDRVQMVSQHRKGFILEGFLLC